MHKAIADKWTAALRSGDFLQGKHGLRNEDDTYCCLGVLCELATREGVISPIPKPDYATGYYYGSIEGNYSSSILPDSVRDWAGMDTSLGYVGNDPDNQEDDSLPESWLTSLNDSGTSFLGIADIIDSKWAML